MSVAAGTLAALERAFADRPPPRVRALHLPAASSAGKDAEFGALELDDGTLGLCYLLLDGTLDALATGGAVEALAGTDALALARRWVAGQGPQRALGFAAVNALTRHLFDRAGFVPPPATDSIGGLDPRPGEHVGMVGFFPPLVKQVTACGARLTVVELRADLAGERAGFRITLDPRELRTCDKVLTTSTVLLNDTLDEILSHCVRARAIAMIGPGAGCLPDALFARGVTMLGARGSSTPAASSAHWRPASAGARSRASSRSRATPIPASTRCSGAPVEPPAPPAVPMPDGTRASRPQNAAIRRSAWAVVKASGWPAAMSAVAVWAGLAAASPLSAAEPPAAGASPRIGLALSGGGARGIAHVGVLKVLEELRVPVHCVTGTSMGAIVGATFAAGRTPQEMEKLVLEADWETIFRDRPPREEIAVRRKIDDYKTLFAPEYGVKDGGLALPKGVIAGVSIESFFRQLAAPALEVTDFRRLPIPFRAMATDIETGQAVVLDSGSLAQAMRASMSVPGAIAPVERDGRLLVDGGIANNLPIDEARTLCADVVIAVNISTPPLKRDQLTSALQVTGQLINFLGMQTVDAQLRSLGERDVLIAPDLGDISAATFDRSADAIRIGEQATRALTDRLARYSLPPEQYAALRAKQVVAEKGLGTVDQIRVEGLERTNPAVVRSLVESRPGEPLTEERLGADLRRVFGTRDFESIGYRIVGGDAGPRALLIEPREKEWGPDYLRFGLGLATDFSGENQFNVLVQYRRTWLNPLGAERLTEVQIGQDTHLYTEFYQPLNKAGRWFVAPSAFIGRTMRGVFDGEGNRVADYLTDVAQAGVDLGARLGTWGEVRAGPVWASFDARPETGSPVLPSQRDTLGGLRGLLFVDQTDNAWFPTSGYALVGDAYAALSSFGSDREYRKFNLGGRAIHTWGRYTLNVALRGGKVFGSDAPAYETFTLGGPLNLSSYRIDELSGQQYAFGRLMVYRRAVALPDVLGSGVYVGASGEVGRIDDRAFGLPSPGTVWSSSLFLGADTFLGPLFFGAGYGANDRFSLYLLMGAP